MDTGDTRPTPTGRRGPCPCCCAADRSLVLCRRCDWLAAAPEARADAKARVEEFSPGAGRRAYNAGGCAICETCWSQMGTNALACPLRLFYEAGLPARQRELPAERGFGDTVCAQWEQWLAERDWPETNEIHWRRLVDFMVAEKEQA